MRQNNVKNELNKLFSSIMSITSILTEVNFVSEKNMKNNIIIDWVKNLYFTEEKKLISDNNPNKKIQIIVAAKIKEYWKDIKTKIGMRKIPPESWILSFSKNFWCSSPE